MRRSVRLGYPLLVAILLLGLAGAGLAYWVGMRLVTPDRLGPRTVAVVAIADIPAGAVVGPGMVALATVEADPRLPAAATSIDEVVGQVVVDRIAAGELVPLASLRPAPPAVDEPRLTHVIPPGRRAVVVAFVESEGQDGPTERPIEAGETVDVVASFPRGTEGLEEGVTATVARGALVLSISPDSTEGPGGAATPTGRPARGGVATLAVTPQEAQFLTLAQRSGEVRLVRR